MRPPTLCGRLRVLQLRLRTSEVVAGATCVRPSVGRCHRQRSHDPRHELQGGFIRERLGHCGGRQRTLCDTMQRPQRGAQRRHQCRALVVVGVVASTLPGTHDLSKCGCHAGLLLLQHRDVGLQCLQRDFRDGKLLPQRGHACV